MLHRPMQNVASRTSTKKGNEKAEEVCTAKESEELGEVYQGKR